MLIVRRFLDDFSIILFAFKVDDRLVSVIVQCFEIPPFVNLATDYVVFSFAIQVVLVIADTIVLT